MKKARRALASALTTRPTPASLASPGSQAAADMNGDGVVNSIDSALILQFTAGLLDSLPP